MSGVELLLSGVAGDEGLVVPLGLEEFMSELLASEPVLELAGAVEFVSVVEDGEVVEEGEVAVLDPVWLEDEDGLLCALLLPAPAPLPSLPPMAVPLLLLCAIAIPAEKITAVAIVRSLLLICVFSLSAVISVVR